jgi:hypothetical protein
LESIFFLKSPARNPFNPQPLISHLTNSNGCGNPVPGSADVSTLGTLLFPEPTPYPKFSHFGTPFVFNALRALFLSCASFSRSYRLFSIACALFDKNTRGWGCLTYNSVYRSGSVPLCRRLPRPGRGGKASPSLCLGSASSDLHRPLLTRKPGNRPPDLHNFGAPITTFRINTCISVASKRLYPPLESTLTKKGGEGEGVSEGGDVRAGARLAGGGACGSADLAAEERCARNRRNRGTTLQCRRAGWRRREATGRALRTAD